MHPVLGGYHINDINFTAAFDIDINKVGKDLSEAIFAEPNNTFKFADVPHHGRARRPRHDARRPRQVPLRRSSRRRPAPPPTSSASSRDTKTDVVINYLPVGSEEATKWYVEQVLAAGCAFVNCIPVFIAREEYWGDRFRRGRPAHRRRRHQVAGRRHHPAPRARTALRGPRRAHRPHLPAELRRQHRLPQHARARAPRVEEDLEDQRRDLADRLRDAGRRRPRRPLRPRAVAARTASGATSASRARPSATCR